MLKRFGKEKTKYQGRQYMTLFDRFHTPNYYQDPGEAAQGGEIEILDEYCDGCGLCVRVCPADTLVLQPLPDGTGKQGKKTKKQVMRMSEEAECVACGDCAAVCPNDACYVTKPVRMDVSLFKTINRGGLSLPRLFNEKKK